MPLWDLFYFVRSAAVGVARRTGARDALAGVEQRALRGGPARRTGSSMRSAGTVAGTGLDGDLVEPLFQLCWMHRALKASSTLRPAGSRAATTGACSGGRSSGATRRDCAGCSGRRCGSRLTPRANRRGLRSAGSVRPRARSGRGRRSSPASARRPPGAGAARASPWTSAAHHARPASSIDRAVGSIPRPASSRPRPTRNSVESHGRARKAGPSWRRSRPRRSTATSWSRSLPGDPGRVGRIPVDEPRQPTVDRRAGCRSTGRRGGGSPAGRPSRSPLDRRAGRPAPHGAAGWPRSHAGRHRGRAAVRRRAGRPRAHRPTWRASAGLDRAGRRPGRTVSIVQEAPAAVPCPSDLGASGTRSAASSSRVAASRPGSPGVPAWREPEEARGAIRIDPGDAACHPSRTVEAGTLSRLAAALSAASSTRSTGGPDSKLDEGPGTDGGAKVPPEPGGQPAGRQPMDRSEPKPGRKPTGESSERALAGHGGADGSRRTTTPYRAPGPRRRRRAPTSTPAARAPSPVRASTRRAVRRRVGRHERERDPGEVSGAVRSSGRPSQRRPAHDPRPDQRGDGPSDRRRRPRRRPRRRHGRSEPARHSASAGPR